MKDTQLNVLVMGTFLSAALLTFVAMRIPQNQLLFGSVSMVLGIFTGALARHLDGSTTNKLPPGSESVTTLQQKVETPALSKVGIINDKP